MIALYHTIMLWGIGNELLIIRLICIHYPRKPWKKM